MINHRLLTPSFATDVALSVLHHSLAHAAEERLKQAVKEAVSQRHPMLGKEAMFDALYKAIAPYERKFEHMINGIWREEEAIIVANLKKLKKAWLRKDTFDDVSYPVTHFQKKIEDESEKLVVEVMGAEGERQVARYGFDIEFDSNTSAIKKWLKKYIPQFSEALEEVNIEELRKALIEGMEAGEGIPQLIKRVNATYDNWTKYRSESIARSEVIRASSKAAIETYKQSGIVEKKIWIAEIGPRTCGFCLKMDGKIISLEKNFFDKGDSLTIEDDEGKSQTMDFDYTDIDGPPAHTRCRCAVAAYFEERAFYELVKKGKLLIMPDVFRLQKWAWSIN